MATSYLLMVTFLWAGGAVEHWPVTLYHTQKECEAAGERHVRERVGVAREEEVGLTVVFRCDEVKGAGSED
jgi:hypothetical protein